jgi:hypothetical protein
MQFQREPIGKPQSRRFISPWHGLHRPAIIAATMALLFGAVAAMAQAPDPTVQLRLIQWASPLPGAPGVSVFAVRCAQLTVDPPPADLPPWRLCAYGELANDSFTPKLRDEYGDAASMDRNATTSYAAPWPAADGTFSLTSDLTAFREANDEATALTPESTSLGEIQAFLRGSSGAEDQERRDWVLPTYYSGDTVTRLQTLLHRGGGADFFAAPADDLGIAEAPGPSEGLEEVPEQPAPVGIAEVKTSVDQLNALFTGYFGPGSPWAAVPNELTEIRSEINGLMREPPGAEHPSEPFAALLSQHPRTTAGAAATLFIVGLLSGLGLGGIGRRRAHGHPGQVDAVWPSDDRYQAVLKKAKEHAGPEQDIATTVEQLLRLPSPLWLHDRLRDLSAPDGFVEPEKLEAFMSRLTAQLATKDHEVRLWRRVMGNLLAPDGLSAPNCSAEQLTALADQAAERLRRGLGLAHPKSFADLADEITRREVVSERLLGLVESIGQDRTKSIKDYLAGATGNTEQAALDAMNELRERNASAHGFVDVVVQATGHHRAALDELQGPIRELCSLVLAASGEAPDRAAEDSLDSQEPAAAGGRFAVACARFQQNLKELRDLVHPDNHCGLNAVIAAVRRRTEALDAVTPLFADANGNSLACFLSAGSTPPTGDTGPAGMSSGDALPALADAVSRLEQAQALHSAVVDAAAVSNLSEEELRRAVVSLCQWARSLTAYAPRGEDENQANDEAAFPAVVVHLQRGFSDLRAHLQLEAAAGIGAVVERAEQQAFIVSAAIGVFDARLFEDDAEPVKGYLSADDAAKAAAQGALTKRVESIRAAVAFSHELCAALNWHGREAGQPPVAALAKVLTAVLAGAGSSGDWAARLAEAGNGMAALREALALLPVQQPADYPSRVSSMDLAELLKEAAAKVRWRDQRVQELKTAEQRAAEILGVNLRNGQGQSGSRLVAALDPGAASWAAVRKSCCADASDWRSIAAAINGKLNTARRLEQEVQSSLADQRASQLALVPSEDLAERVRLTFSALYGRSERVAAAEAEAAKERAATDELRGRLDALGDAVDKTLPLLGVELSPAAGGLQDTDARQSILECLAAEDGRLRQLRMLVSGVLRRWHPVVAESARDRSDVVEALKLREIGEQLQAFARALDGLSREFGGKPDEDAVWQRLFGPSVGAGDEQPPWFELHLRLYRAHAALDELFRRAPEVESARLLLGALVAAFNCVHEQIGITLQRWRPLDVLAADAQRTPARINPDYLQLAEVSALKNELQRRSRAGAVVVDMTRVGWQHGDESRQATVVTYAGGDWQDIPAGLVCASSGGATDVYPS